MTHTHIITDHDDHFIIDAVTRKIHPETPSKNKLVRNDHKCERYTFEIPRYIEDHDMAQCDSVRIHYVNVSSDNSKRNADVYEVDDLGVLQNDSEKAAFTWLISRNATMYAGALNFAIEFKCFDGETITYAWHTEIYFSITISDVIANDQQIIDEYSDIIEGWKRDSSLMTITGYIAFFSSLELVNGSAVTIDFDTIPVVRGYTPVAVIPEVYRIVEPNGLTAQLMEVSVIKNDAGTSVIRAVFNCSNVNASLESMIQVRFQVLYMMV